MPAPRTGAQLTASAASISSFRLAARFSTGRPATPLPTPMLAPAVETVGDTAARFGAQRVQWGSWQGVASAAGALVIHADSGGWELRDAKNDTVLSGAAPVISFAERGADQTPTVLFPTNGTAGIPRMQPGLPRDKHGSPCLANGVFTPPFHYDNLSGSFAMGVSPFDRDQVRQECYPASPSFVPEPASSCGQVLAGHDVSGGMRMAQFAKLTQAQCCDRCDAEPGQRCTAWIYGAPGHEDSKGNNCWLMTGSSDSLKPTTSQYRTAGGRVLPGSSPPPPNATLPHTTWSVLGTDADLYLAVTPNGTAFQRTLYELTGAPALPPRYALGFHASWWGYRTYADVTTNMSAFRKGLYPVDSFIM